MRRLRIGLLLLAAAPLQAATGRAEDAMVSLDARARSRSEVYITRHVDACVEPGDLELLRSGRMRIPHFGVLETRRFVFGRLWKATRSKSLRYAIHELRFLLPLAASARDDDRALLERRILDWANACGRPATASDAWRDPMTVAWRVLVLVYVHWTDARMRSSPSPLRERVARLVETHCAFLADRRHYDVHTNHGLVESFALLEAGRYLGRVADERTGARRLRTQLERSFSPQGTYRERSAQYHFAVGRWVRSWADYLGRWEAVDDSLLSTLVRTARRIDRSGRFLTDLDGLIVPVGDTDSVTAEAYGIDASGPSATVCRGRARALDVRACFHDPDVGYAAYRNPDAGDRRYVVLSCPVGRFAPRVHAHNDATALFVSVDGEILLGDAGRYTYDRGSGIRRSPRAGRRAPVFRPADARNHNLALWPRRWLLPLRCVDSRMETRGRVVTMQAALRPLIAGASAGVVRTVTIPPRARAIVSVRDVFRMSRTTSLRIAWHLGCDVRRVLDVRKEPGGCRVDFETVGGRRYVMDIVAPRRVIDSTTVYGPEARRAWYSPAERILRPVGLVTAYVTVSGCDSVVTTIRDARPRLTPPWRPLAGLGRRARR